MKTARSFLSVTLVGAAEAIAVAEIRWFFGLPGWPPHTRSAQPRHLQLL